MDELKETTKWIPEKLPPKNIDDPEVTSNDTSATSSSGNDPLKPKIKKREVWGQKIDFLLACVGFSVGLGNVWRFPFLCYRNGGGAFLIPYFLAVIFCGIPCFFLEVCLGQFMAQGGVSAWKIVPLFQGIGFASCIIVFLLNCEYNIILTWALYYLFSSFNSVLPWSHGNNEWNSENCTKLYTQKAANLSNSLLNSTMGYVSSAVDNVTSVNSNMTNESSLTKLTCDPVTEFWERKVLSLSSGVDHPGAIKWDLALCLLLAWIIVYFCIWKGIKSSGKVMYFTATSPYIFMFVLLIRGVTLDGAELGLKYYLLPDWSKLLETQVWVDAGTQIVFTYSLALGTLTALGSYNKFHHNAFRDTIIFSCINSFTSLLAGLVIFSVLGFMAKRQGVSIADVAESGPGLAFIAYPEAVAQMPAAPFWSVLFFVMILLLGLDSQFVGVEGFVTAIVDFFPNHLRVGKRREIFIGLVCIVCFLIGLSMVTEGGMYVFQLFDYYAASRIVLVMTFFECVVVAYIYGVNRFYDNMMMMFGYKLSSKSETAMRLLKYMWAIVTPIFSMGIFIIGAISYSELDYKRKTFTYQYPKWAIGVGWVLALISVVWIPIIFVTRLLQTPGTLRERLAINTMPHLQRHQIRHGEDMSKIILVDDDGTHLEDFATGTNTEPTILANSMEYEKFLQKETNSDV
uniref:Transporter n=1 Tax=Bathymodiolus septemdierum TaxID=220392 RepID=A9CTL3_9BIVA|nr:taurine transporter [Bathymodiolus septemdierum]